MSDSLLISNLTAGYIANIPVLHGSTIRTMYLDLTGRGPFGTARPGVRISTRG